MEITAASRCLCRAIDHRGNPLAYHREGELKLWLEEVPLPRPRPNELVVRVEAAPLNPSDQILMLGSST